MTATAPVLMDYDAKKPNVVFGIQVLRGIAASLVVARHCLKEYENSLIGDFSVGQAGVDIFFVISGFVIYLTGRKLDFSTFFRRRIARIVPLYWIVLLFAGAGRIIVGKADGDYVLNVIASFLFIPGPLLFPPISVGWTLNFEMWFYIICTLVLAIGGRRYFAQLVSLIIVGAIGIGFLLPRPGVPEFWPGAMLMLPISLEFLAGIWLTKLWLSGRRASPVQSWLLIAAAFVWLALAPESTPLTVLRPLYWGVPAVAIVWAVLSLEDVIRFRGWKVALALGDASYALYLIHMLVIAVLVRLIDRYAPGLNLFMAVSIVGLSCLLAGFLFHYLVEKPVVRAASRLLGLKKAKAAHPSATLASAGVA